MTSTEQVTNNDATEREIRSALKTLQGIPPLRVQNDETEAQVCGVWYRIDYLRKITDESVLAELDVRGVPWTWLGSRATSRAEHHEQWAVVLEENGRRPWITAEALYDSALAMGKEDDAGVSDRGA